tara:strand:- start:16581 stop:16847 length:267 start_codon:yes stop_codon:yes gene_type:complete
MQKNITHLHDITPDQLKRDIVSEIKEYLDEKFPDTKGKDELLTRKQVAKLLEISLPTLRNYVKRGLIPEKRVGARVLYSKKELLASLV